MKLVYVGATILLILTVVALFVVDLQPAKDEERTARKMVLMQNCLARNLRFDHDTAWEFWTVNAFCAGDSDYVRNDHE